MLKPEESKQAGFPWGRALRIGSITAASFAVVPLVADAVTFGFGGEDLVAFLVFFLGLALPCIAVAAAVLRYRRHLRGWEVGLVTALVIGGVLWVFGFIVYIAVHMNRV